METEVLETETEEATAYRDEREVVYINGHAVRKGTGLSRQDIEELSDIFTGLNLDARELRRHAWKR